MTSEIRWDDDPTVAWVRSESDPDRWYRVTDIHSLYPRCACPAGENGNDCKHLVALMREAEKEMNRMEEQAKQETTTRALAPRQVSMRERAQLQREAMAQARGGFEDAKYLALQQKDMWPDELKEAEKREEGSGVRQAALIVQTAMELGVTWTQAFSYITAIKGKPFLMARMVNALVNSRGVGHITYPKRTPTEVTAKAVRTGREPISVTITMGMAEKAGWTRNTLYKSNPTAMLTARATTTVAWLQFPDILAGMDAVEMGDDGGYEVMTVKESEETTPAVAVEQEAEEELPPIEGEVRDLPDDAPEAPELFGKSQIPWDELKGRMSVRLGELGLDWKDLKRVEDWPAEAGSYQDGITRWAREHADTAVETTLPTLAHAARSQAQAEQPSMLAE